MISTGETICTYYGEIMTNIEKDAKYNLSNGIEADRLLQIRPFGNEIEVFVDGAKCSAGTYANCNHNTTKENNAIFVERRVTSQNNETYIGLVELKAVMTIEEGSEILVDYGDQYWKGKKEFKTS